VSQDGEKSLAKTLWSPEKRVVVAMLVWLTLLALGSAFVATPFFDQREGMAPDYAHTMYLHGLLIGMVGLLGLIAMDVFGAGHKSRTAHNLILWGTLGAALFSGVGGIFDHTVEDTFFLWMQIVSFFFLDEILITLTFALFYRAVETRVVATWLAAFAALSGFVAAVMGHIAGWILEFGNYPAAIVGGYAALAAESWQSLLTHLISAHAHDMVVAVLALLVATTCFYFSREGCPNRLARFGLWWTAIGTLVMTLVYIVEGFSQAQPPVLFSHAISGIAGDDFITGVGVMLGAVLALAGLAADRLPGALTRWGSALLSALLLVIVPVVGFFIETHENLFNHRAASAPRGAADLIYGWYHQDFAFFILPAVMVLLLVLELFARDGRQRRSAIWTLLAGSTLAFLGGVLYVFVSSAVYGISFLIATVGIAALVAGTVLSIWAVASPSSRQSTAEQAPLAHRHAS
jgi:hypothetical protein